MEHGKRVQWQRIGSTERRHTVHQIHDKSKFVRRFDMIAILGTFRTKVVDPDFGPLITRGEVPLRILWLGADIRVRE